MMTPDEFEAWKQEQDVEDATHTIGWWFDRLTGKTAPLKRNLRELRNVEILPNGTIRHYANGAKFFVLAGTQMELRIDEAVKLGFMVSDISELSAEDCAFLWDAGVRADSDIINPPGLEIRK